MRSAPLGRRLVRLVSAALLVESIFYGTLAPLLPHYAATLGIDKRAAGILVAAYPVGTLLGALPTGLGVARFGSRPSLAAGLGVIAASTLVFGWSSSVWLLDSSRFVQGIGGACIWNAGLAWLADTAPSSERGRVVGRALTAGVAGVVLGPPFGALAVHVGTGAAFSAAALSAALLAIACGLSPSSPHRERRTSTSLLRMWRKPHVAAGLWLLALAGAGFAVFDVLVPLRLTRLGAPTLVVSTAFLGGSVAQAILSPQIGRLVDRRGPWLAVRWSLATCAVLCAAAPGISLVAALVTVTILALPSFGSIVVPSITMVSDAAERHGLYQGVGFGVANLAWALGMGCAALISGGVAQATSDAVPYSALVVLTVATLAASLRPHSAGKSAGNGRALAESPDTSLASTLPACHKTTD
jgi:DHA1 family multidrug resistance protein-like MFS transporter